MMYAVHHNGKNKIFSATGTARFLFDSFFQFHNLSWLKQASYNTGTRRYVRGKIKKNKLLLVTGTCIWCVTAHAVYEARDSVSFNDLPGSKNI